MVWRLVLVLLLVPLSGCQDAPEASADEAAEIERPIVDRGGVVEPPTWRIGDHWTYRANDGSEPTFVVAEDAGDNWIMATDDPARAFYEARTGSALVGPIAKNDLRALEADGAVQWLQFPLIDGSTWAGSWDGVPMTFTATESDGMFTIEAAADGSVHHRLRYDPSIGWFRSFAFGDGDSFVLELELTSHGSAYNGELVSYELTSILDEQMTPMAPFQEFTVGDGFDDLWLEYEIRCQDFGLIAFDVSPVDDPALLSERYELIACPSDPIPFAEPIAPIAGEWVAMFAGVDAATSAVIDIEVIGRTLVRASFP